MIRRKIYPDVVQSLGKFPIVGLLGSRQVGKTTLAKLIQKKYPSSVYVDLELSSDFFKLEEPELYLSKLQDRLVIIDEIQRKPELFPLLRALVDQKRNPGRFLILGSSSPDIIKKSSESLAGRIIYHYLAPFSLLEIGAKNYEKLWLRGGYPESYLAKNNDDSFNWRNSFISIYLERDIPQLGIKIPSSQIRRFWTMLSHLQCQVANYSLIAKSMDLSTPTIRKYLDILEDTFMARALPSYFVNIKKRIMKSSKIYIRDNGLLHNLLGISNTDSLYSSPYLGNSWESFAIEQIINSLPKYWEFYYFRTQAGAEIDLLLLDQNKNPIAIEVKHSLAPKASKGFFNSIGDLNCSKAFLVYPGKDSYEIKKNVSTNSILQIEKLFS